MPEVVVPRLWTGTVVCIASGPTLCQEDVDAVRGRWPVIAVNDGVRLAPWADVVYSSDRMWWPHYQGLPDCRAMKYSVGSFHGKANPFYTLPNVQVLRHCGERGLEDDPSGLRTGKNSGYAAINLAMHLGASRILLLGYTMGRRGGQDHFFGSHPSALTSTSDSVYALFRSLYLTLVEPLAARRIEVVNCTPDTWLTCFPWRCLTDVLCEVPTC